MRRVIAVVAALGLLALMSGPALALGTLDQSQTNGSVTSLTWSLPAVAGSRMDLRQTFVVGRTGTLTSVWVWGDDFGAAVTLKLLSTGGTVDTQSVNMTGSSWTQVTLSTPPKVTSGEVMTLGLMPSNEINWYGTCDDLYPNGEALVFDPSARVVESIPQYGISTGNSIGYCTQDFAFETYVTVPAATPVPTAKPATPAPSLAKPAATSSGVASAAPSGTASAASETSSGALDTAAPTANATPSLRSPQPAGSGSTSAPGDSGGSIGIIVIALVVVGAAAAGVAWWLLGARRKRSPGEAAQ